MSEKENRISLAKEYMEEGRNALYDNKLDEAAILVQKAIDLFKEAEDVRNHASSLNLMGVIYASLGNESMAIDYYLEGLNLIGNGEYDDIRILFYNNIGSRYHDLKDYHKGLYYFLKSEELLKSENVKNNSRYKIWCMVSYLNVLSSYLALEMYDRCYDYIDRLDEYEKYDENSFYIFGYHVCKYLLYYRTDKKDFVRNNIDILLKEAIEDKNVFDQVQNFTDMCTLLKEMGEINRWFKAIASFESRAKAINNNYLLLFCSELWMEYFKAVDNEKAYNQMCIRHAELYFKQKEIDNKDKVASIDIKIALQEKEMEREMALKKSNTDALTGLGNRNALTAGPWTELPSPKRWRWPRLRPPARRSAAQRRQRWGFRCGSRQSPWLYEKRPFPGSQSSHTEMRWSGRWGAGCLRWDRNPRPGRGEVWC